MRTRDLDRLDRKLARLLGTHIRDMDYCWRPSSQIASALTAVEQALIAALEGAKK